MNYRCHAHDANISTYTKSKTLAEKAAWEFMANLPAESAMELVCVNPGGVFGPPLGKSITGQTLTVIDQMLRGKMPMVPDVAMPMVDLRDVAELHALAMITPEAAGKRIIGASAEPGSFRDIAKILKDKGYKGPSTRRPPPICYCVSCRFLIARRRARSACWA